MKVNVGTIGHIDYGKTTLMQALVTVLSKEVGKPSNETAAERRKTRNSKDRKARMKAAQLKAFKGE